VILQLHFAAFRCIPLHSAAFCCITNLLTHARADALHAHMLGS
jgi:hypothetical protein